MEDPRDERCEMCSYFMAEPDEEPCASCLHMLDDGFTEDGMPPMFELSDDFE